MYEIFRNAIVEKEAEQGRQAVAQGEAKVPLEKGCWGMGGKGSAQAPFSAATLQQR